MEALIKRNFFDLEMKHLIRKEESGDKLYEVVHRPTDTTYFLKEFDGLYDSNDRAEINLEIEILKQLNHPNLLKCHEVFQIGNRISLLLEHVDGRSPIGYDITSESSLVSIIHQLLLGLGYLHQKKISHGDIKPSNIFMNSMGQVKVLYLGNILRRATVDLTEIGAVHNEFSWDVWNVGFCILKLFKGDDKFDENIYLFYRPRDFFFRSQAMVQKPSIQLWRFLFCCMQTETNVSKKWTIKKLLGHPYFEHVPDISLKEKMQLSVVHASPLSMALSVECVSTLSFEGDQISPRTKKSKIPFIYEVECSKDPTQIVPHVLGRCIQHCALFLLGCEFEKDKLIQMWIAEECMEFDETKIMEDVANLYFDALVHQEVIIPSKFDHLYRQMKYKVNTSKVSTWFLEQGNYIRIDNGNLDNICGEALHLTWHCKRLDQTSVLVDALKILKQLRTLLVLMDCNVLTKHLPNDIFLGLKLLRTLDLSRTYILELPGSIGLLEALRYLDISENPIKRLPQSIDCLHFLQTLKLRGCVGLSALPKGLGRLVNLRHLDLNVVGQLEFMPSGMGNLVKLQTLQAFIVGKNDGCGIGELKYMNEITGSFCIYRLENVSSAKEAKEAMLSDKKRIDMLELRWQDYGNENSQDTTEILECLQPHYHLKELQITVYSGLKLPSWISSPSYTDLASITLYKCINCDILPSIGELPSLKILHIVEMRNLRNINSLFCRAYGIQGFSASPKQDNAFPKLEKLMLENMLNLEEWTGIEDGDFPCLSHISIRYCPKLYVLPSLSYLYSLQHLEINHCMQLFSLPEGLFPVSLESLIIKGCPKINERCIKDQGQDWFKIACIKNVWIDFEKISLDQGL